MNLFWYLWDRAKVGTVFAVGRLLRVRCKHCGSREDLTYAPGWHLHKDWTCMRCLSEGR